MVLFGGSDGLDRALFRYRRAISDIDSSDIDLATLESLLVDLIQIIGIALALAMDAFSVSIAVGLTLGRANPRQLFRLSYHFGLFQGLMPLIGWFAGVTIGSYISGVDHWLALALLGYVGFKMIKESFEDEKDRIKGDPTRGSSLVILSVATSIDALAVGLSLGFLGVPVLFPALVIGLVTGALTFLGMKIGKNLGALFGVWMERIGGTILILIGIRIVLEHTIGF